MRKGTLLVGGPVGQALGPSTNKATSQRRGRGLPMRRTRTSSRRGSSSEATPSSQDGSTVQPSIVRRRGEIHRRDPTNSLQRGLSRSVGADDADDIPPRVERQDATRNGANRRTHPQPSTALITFLEGEAVARGLSAGCGPPAQAMVPSARGQLVPTRHISERSAKTLEREGNEQCCVCLDPSAHGPARESSPSTLPALIFRIARPCLQWVRMTRSRACRAEAFTSRTQAAWGAGWSSDRPARCVDGKHRMRPRSPPPSTARRASSPGCDSPRAERRRRHAAHPHPSRPLPKPSCYSDSPFWVAACTRVHGAITVSR